MIQKYQTLILAAIVLAAIFFLGLFGWLITDKVIGHLEKNDSFIQGELVKSDTVVIYKEFYHTETLKLQPIKMDGTVTPEILISNNIPIDTNKFKFNELPINVYSDTIRKDSSYVIVTDNVAGWRTNAKVDFYLKYPVTTITNTTVKQRLRLYTYMRFGSNFNSKPLLTSAAPGVGIVTKRGIVTAYDYNFMNKSHNFTVGYVISFKK